MQILSDYFEIPPGIEGENLDRYKRELSSAVCAVADVAKDDPFVSDLYEPDEILDYARRCVADAIEYDKVPFTWIAENAAKVVERDISFA
jgi:hypothetical protein